MKKLFTGEFKKNVVLEALKEEKTISELASENEIDSRQIFRWKKLVIERIEIEKLNGILSSQVVYTFDDYNNRKSMMNNDVMTDYEYDKNNRLINEVKVNNEITETTKYFYDNNGNQIYKGTDIIAPDDGSDASIGMSVVGTNTESSSVYNEYDGLNQLISTAVHDKVVLYSYDSDGLRASKSVNGSKTDYIWDGQNIVAEINNGTLTNKYIRGINLIYGDFNGVKNWYLFNGHGDVVGLSDVNGNVLKLYDYDAFGVEKGAEAEVTPKYVYNDDSLLGSDGNCEDTSGWIPDIGRQLQLESNVKLFGDSSFKIPMTGYQESPCGITSATKYPITAGKYYFYSMYFTSDSPLSPNARLYVGNQWSGYFAFSGKNGVWERNGFKFAADTTSFQQIEIDFYNPIPGNPGYTSYIDGLQLIEITEDDYNNLTVEELMAKYSRTKVDNPFRYCGEYFDAETGEYYLRARDYNPGVGRFTQEDSYRGKDRDPLMLNLYTYCANNPLKFVDPSGHYYETPLDAIFLGIDLNEIKNDPTSIENWAALVADGVCVVLPGAVGGGIAVRELSKVTKKGWNKFMSLFKKEMNKTTNFAEGY